MCPTTCIAATSRCAHLQETDSIGKVVAPEVWSEVASGTRLTLVAIVIVVAGDPTETGRGLTLGERCFVTHTLSQTQIMVVNSGKLLHSRAVQQSPPQHWGSYITLLLRANTPGIKRVQLTLGAMYKAQRVPNTTHNKQHYPTVTNSLVQLRSRLCTIKSGIRVCVYRRAEKTRCHSAACTTHGAHTQATQ